MAIKAGQNAKARQARQYPQSISEFYFLCVCFLKVFIKMNSNTISFSRVIVIKWY